MSIYNRNKEGILTPVNITVIKGEKGKDGKDGITPNIEIGEVKTIPAGKEAEVRRRGNKENPIYDFNIPKGVNGEGASCDLDDNVISQVDGWSSDKISKWSIEQDGVVWVEKEGDFISVDNTYEYKLKEIEIFGDTWQDSDSKNLFDGIISGYEKTSDGRYKVNSCHVFAELRDIQLKPDTQYTIGIVESTSLKYTWVTVYVGDTIYGSNNKSSFTFTTDSTGLIKLKGGAPGYVFEEAYVKDFQLNEGSVLLEYDKYHKADLSNIQHVGELYVDEDGEPKLDKQGRKQYKIEVGTVNRNLFNDSSLTKNKNGLYDIPDGFSTNIYLKPNSTYYLNPNIVGGGFCKIIIRDSNGFELYGKNLDHIIGHNDHKKISTSDNLTNKIIFKLCSVVKSNLSITDKLGDSYTPHQSHKETIILPCQLSRVGNIKDRLFWDESKGEYIVEKNIGKKIINKNTGFRQIHHLDNNIFSVRISDMKCTNDTIHITSNNKTTNIYNVGKVEYIGYSYNSIDIDVAEVRFMESLDTTLQDFISNRIGDKDITIFYGLKTPELIETDIAEPLYLPTYNNKTHIYHINDNNTKATIKAKFPLKTSNTLSTLSLQNSTISNEIISIQESNTDLIANNFENDFRVSELEWNLTDAGLYSSSENKKIISNSLSLTRFEQAKILILSNKYDKEKMTYQLTKYLERGYLDQEEFNILIELMENE